MIKELYKKYLDYDLRLHGDRVYLKHDVDEFVKELTAKSDSLRSVEGV